MVISTNIRHVESTSTSSLTCDGAVTPTESEALGDDSAIQEGLGSLNLDSDPSTNNKQTSLCCDHHKAAIESVKSPKVTRMSHPHPGDVYLIAEKSKARVLACKRGHLRLENVNAMDFEGPISDRWLWFCIEKDGFKGFQNVAEGGFIGRDIWWDFYAKVPHHKGWESFTVTIREGGYYWIQILDWWTQWQLSTRSDGSGVCAERDGGTLWEFVKVVKMSA